MMAASGLQSDMTDYIVHATTHSTDDAGDLMREALARGIERVTVSAVDEDGPRPIQADELERVVARGVATAPGPYVWDADKIIGALEAIGHEDLARELYGDARVDTWFREHADTDPDAARSDG